MKLSFLSAAMIFFASNAIAQHAHQFNLANETGQSQFATIAEIVSLLRVDPETDWAQVDIKELREHLVDNDNVTTKASVERTVDELSVTFSITGDKVAAASIQRMVLAYSPMLQQSSDWSVIVQKQEGGAKMMLQVSSEDDFNQVLGLGFFGLMTIGAHHQQYHLMIATGQLPLSKREKQTLKNGYGEVALSRTADLGANHSEGPQSAINALNAITSTCRPSSRTEVFGTAPAQRDQRPQKLKEVSRKRSGQWANPSWPDAAETSKTLTVTTDTGSSSSHRTQTKLPPNEITVPFVKGRGPRCRDL